MNPKALREIAARVALALDANEDGDPGYVHELLTDLKNDLDEAARNAEGVSEP